MTRLLMIALAATVLAAPAHAISRYNSQGMSCNAVQAAVQREGAVILRYRSARNPSLPLYDRYVSGGRFCSVGEVAVGSSVPTRDDRSCYVLKCRSYERENVFPFRD
ncbi:hypothetical protein [Aquibium sp. ELW1220]|jgi:hypothetical protein|uniref:hypothetical protein n=1 Tax=Aquibium sp. ELW1220 TaxID=2976766 RepID=UPI0025AF3209|nr:hypothetical protein [Aquibium sp. ELW1220]MDN2580710.1 hypothetical protein [Aquibium sp. ELW1220]